LKNPEDAPYFTYHWTLYTNHILKPRFLQPKGRDYMLCHDPLPHEIGHALGLEHIGRVRGIGTCNLASTCSHDDQYANNPSASYWDVSNIMGCGSNIVRENADPWVRRMQDHLYFLTPSSGWEAQCENLLPRPL